MEAQRYFIFLKNYSTPDGNTYDLLHGVKCSGKLGSRQSYIDKY